MYPEIVAQPFFLPKRNRRDVGKIQNSERMSFVTNFYNVKMHYSLNKIFVYQVKFPPQIPSDSTQIVNRCLFQLRAELRETVGFICFTGKIVYGFKENTLPLAFQRQISGNVVQVQLKLIKSLAINELFIDPKTRPMLFHFLNSKLKACLRNANICEVGKAGQYFPKDQLLKSIKQKQMVRQYETLENAGMNVLRGYKFTLVMLNNQLKLQLDVCSRVLQKNNLLQDFNNFDGSNEQLKAFYKNAVIITRYGNYRTYKIQEVDFKLSPASTFEKNGQEVSYQQYYKKAYNAEIYDIKQPLLRVLAQSKKQYNKGQKLQVEQQYIYLIPELVSLTGMKDQQRADFQSMKALAPFTKLNPSDRFYQSCKVLDTLNQAKEVLQIGGYQQMQGYQLKTPKIQFKEYANIKSGSITNRGQLYRSHQFVNWIFAYSSSNQQDFNEAVSIQNYLKQASQAYGINFKEPLYAQITVNNKTKAAQFCQKIIQCAKQRKKVQLIFIILKPKQAQFYGIIKHILTNQLGIPCQVVQTKSFNRGKNILSVASKIAIQMSCKAGDAPWIVDNSIQYFNKRNFAYSAISSSRGKGGYTISFVGTINNSCTQVYSNYILKVQKKERIDGIHLRRWFINWMKSYFMKNKCLPETLIIYRQSAGDSLLKTVIEHEIANLKYSIEEAGTKTKQKNYNPEVVYIMVNKKVNSRFYEADRNQLYNPEPGSIVVQEMSTDDRFDFHLVAQKVTQGTSTPTHYIVGYDSSRIPQQDLIRFTYEQCYNYYNWQGSVKVPSCLQCSNKLSKLAGESIQQPLVDNKTSISETFFFL